MCVAGRGCLAVCDAECVAVCVAVCVVVCVTGRGWSARYGQSIFIISRQMFIAFFSGENLFMEGFCSVLQCVAVCCSVLQRVAASCSELQ